MSPTRLFSLLLVVVLIANQFLSVGSALASPLAPMDTPRYHPINPAPEAGNIAETDVAPIESGSQGQLLFAPVLDTDSDSATNPIASTPVSILKIMDNSAGMVVLAAQVTANGPRDALIRIPVTFRVWNEGGTVYENTIESDAWGAAQAEVRLVNPAGPYFYQMEALGYPKSEIRTFQFETSQPAMTIHGTGATLTAESLPDGAIRFTLRSPQPLESGRDEPALLIARRPVANDGASLFQPILETVKEAGIRLPFPRLSMPLVDANTAQLEVQLPQGDYRFVGSVTVNGSEGHHYLAEPIERVVTNSALVPATTDIAWVAYLEHEAGQTLVQYATNTGKAAFGLVDSAERVALMTPLPQTNQTVTQTWRTGAYEWQQQKYEVTVGEAATENDLVVALDTFDYDPVAHRYALSLRSLTAEPRQEQVAIEVMGPGGIVIHTQEATLAFTPNNPTAYTVEVPAEKGQPQGFRLLVTNSIAAKQTLLSAELVGEEKIVGALANVAEEEGRLNNVITFISFLQVQNQRMEKEKKARPLGLSVMVQFQIKLFINVLEVEVLAITYTAPPGVYLGESPDIVRIAQQVVEGFLFNWWTDTKLVLASGGLNVASDIGVRLKLEDEGCTDPDWESRVSTRLKLIADSFNRRLQDSIGEGGILSKPVESPAVPIWWIVSMWVEGVFRLNAAVDADGLTLNFTFKAEAEASVNIGVNIKDWNILEDAKTLQAVGTYFVVAIDMVLLIADLSMDNNASSRGEGCAGDNWNPNPPDMRPPDDRQDIWQSVGHLYERESYEETIGNLNAMITKARALGFTRAEVFFTAELREKELFHFASDIERFHTYMDTVDTISIENTDTLQGIISGMIPIEPTQTITEALVLQNETAAAAIAALTYPAELQRLVDSAQVAERAYLLLYGQELELQHELRALYFYTTMGVVASGFADTTLAALKEAGMEGQLVSLWEGSVDYMGLPAPYFAPDLAPRALIMPSGGMHRVAGSPEAQAWLEAYVNGGGTLVVFTQAFGTDWNALPGGEVYGVGYEEDQRCQQESVRAGMPSPWLAWMGVATPDIQVDGAFTSWPANANLLLLRRSGLYEGYPAMIEYPFGAGRVLATSAYGDWATDTGMWWGDDWQMTRTLMIRALLLGQGKDIEDVQSALPNSNVNISFPITNTTSFSTTNVRLELPLFTNRLPGYAGNVATVPVTVLPGGASTVNAVLHTPPVMRGVHNWTQVGLFNIRASGNNGNQLLFRYSPQFFHLQSPLAPIEIGLTLTSNPVAARLNQPTTVTATVRNFTDSPKTVELRGLRDLPTAGVLLTIPAQGTATHTYPLTMDRSRFPRAAVYEGTTQRALANLAVYVVPPTLKAIPTLPTIIEAGSMITVTVTNERNPWQAAAPSGIGEVRLALKSPDDVTLWQSTRPLPSLQVNSSEEVRFNVGTLPPAMLGDYTLHYEVYDEGTLREQGVWTVPSTVRIEGTFDRSLYKIRDTLVFSATLHPQGYFDLNSQVKITAPALGLNHTQNVAIAIGDAAPTVSISGTLPATLDAGMYPLTVTFGTAPAVEQTFTIVIPDSHLQVASLSDTLLEAGAPLTVTLANDGGTDAIADYTLKLRDWNSKIIAEETGSTPIQAGGVFEVPLQTPNESLEGVYSLIVEVENNNTGSTFREYYRLDILGAVAMMDVHSDAPVYEVGSPVTAQGTITATTGEITGTLHLEVERVGLGEYGFEESERINSNDEIGYIDHIGAVVAYDAAGTAYAIWVDDRYTTDDIFFATRPNGGSWSASTRVNDVLGVNQRFPDLAVGSDGTAYVVWADVRPDSTGHDIYFSQRPVGGEWSASVRVNSSVTGNQYLPSVAVNENNTVYVAWTDESNPTFGTDIAFAERVLGGSWSPQERVNTDTSAHPQNSVDMVVSQDGAAQLIWMDARDLNEDLYHATRSVGGAWSANIKINTITMPNGGLGRKPTLAIDNAGTLYAGWQNGSTATQGFYVASRPVGGSWGTNQRVTTFLVIAPELEVDNSGTLHALWGRTGDVYYANRPSSGSWTTPSIIHSSTSATQSESTLALAPNGNLLAAWLDTRNAIPIIYADERIATTGSWGVDYMLSDARGRGTQQDVDIEVSNDGTGFAVWQDLRSANSTLRGDIYFATHPVNGAWGVNQPVHNALGTTNYDEYPAVGVDGSNNAYVVWESGATVTNDRIHFAMRDATTGIWTPRTVIHNAVGRQSLPEIAVDTAGNAWAIWADYRRGAATPDIYAAYRPAGGSWLPSERVNDVTAGYHTAFSIAADEQGNAYVAWMEDRDGSGWDIYFSYRPAGGTWSLSVRASDVPTAQQSAPELAVDAEGNAYLVWLDNREAGGGVYKPYVAYRPVGGTWGAGEAIPFPSIPCALNSTMLDITDNGTLIATLHGCGTWITHRTPNGVWQEATPVELEPANAAVTSTTVDTVGNTYVAFQYVSDPMASGGIDIGSMKVTLPMPNVMVWAADVAVATHSTQTISELIGTLEEIPGKYWLSAILKNPLGQQLARTRTPFYITSDTVALTLDSDKTAYFPDESISVTGYLTNTSDTPTTLTLEIQGNDETILTEVHTLAAGEGIAYGTSHTATEDVRFTATAGSASVLHEVMVVEPQAEAVLTVPEAAAGLFDAFVTVTNTGEISISVSPEIQGEDTGTLVLAPGEVGTTSYPAYITPEETLVDAELEGDVEMMLEETVVWGYNAEMSVLTPTFTTEGVMAVPYVMTGTGKLPTSLHLFYQVDEGDVLPIEQSLTLVEGEQVTQTLYLDLEAGAHTIAFRVEDETGWQLDEAELAFVVEPADVGSQPSIRILEVFIGEERGATALTTMAGAPVTLGVVVANDGASGPIIAGAQIADTPYQWVITPTAYTTETFYFTVDLPDDLPAGTYTGQVIVGGQSVPIEVPVAGSDVQLAIALDETAYVAGEMVDLTVTLIEGAGMSGAYPVALRYGTMEEVFTATVGANETVQHTFTFTATDTMEASVTLAQDTPSGQRVIMIDSLPVQVVEPAHGATLILDKTQYEAGESAELTVNVTGTLATLMLIGPKELALNADGFLVWSPPVTPETVGQVPTGTYTLSYTFPYEMKSGEYTFELWMDGKAYLYTVEVRGMNVQSRRMTLNQSHYAPGDTITATVEFINSGMYNVENAELIAQVFKPNGEVVDLTPVVRRDVTLFVGLNVIEVVGVFDTDMAGSHRLVVSVMPFEEPWRIAGAAAQFDVGAAHLVSLTTDHGNYTAGQTGMGRLDVYGMGDTHLVVTASDGSTLLDTTETLGGFESFTFALPTNDEGDYLLVATSTDVNDVVDELQHAYAVPSATDTQGPVITLTSPVTTTFITSAMPTATLTVTGQVNDNREVTQVLVNGEVVTPTVSGAFTTTVTLNQGINGISATALDATSNVGFTPVRVVYLLPARSTTLAAFPSPVVLNERVTFQATLNSSATLEDVLWQLPLPATAFSNVTVNASSGAMTVSDISPSAHMVLWKGDVGSGAVTITVDATAIQTGTIPLESEAFWGWGTRENDTLALTVLEVPTGVTLAEFGATPLNQAIQVHWETAAELDNLGFNLWRGTTPTAPDFQLNEELILSQSPGGGHGAWYEWLDEEVSEGITYYYWLEAVSMTGEITRYGPVEATLSPPTAIILGTLEVAANEGGHRDYFPWWNPTPFGILLMVAGWLWRRRQNMTNRGK